MILFKLRPENSGATMAATHSQPSSALGARNVNSQVPRTQNWVLDPVQDILLIIAAPLCCLGLAILTMHYFGAVEGASLIIVAHVVMTVAHHMPTFIRIYGDVDLLQRFKWHILLGPVVPVSLSIGVLAYINYRQYPVEYFLYLYIFLTLWDPWHFLRQHYGFMRIYDRNNQAPKPLAANLDWAICVVWFAHIMVASADWVPGLLEDLYRNAGIPLLLVYPAGFIETLQLVTWWIAALTTIAYGAYIAWCIKRGYFVSLTKLALLLCTFGVMYFTYIPNEWILQLVPAWSFKIGFATLGIVHMTQYLAIVWRYDRTITQQGRARKGWFSWLHTRRSPLGVAIAVTAYVAFCIGYGDFITSSFDNRWLMSVLLVIGFTSTLLHYYYDGFIWKMRHANNRDALGLSETDLVDKPSTEKESVNEPCLLENPELQISAGRSRPGAMASQRHSKGFPGYSVSSWWNKAREITAGGVLLRQLLYFGMPMGILTLGAMKVWSGDNISYIQRMYQAQAFSEQGYALQASEEAYRAYASMKKELPVAEKLAYLRPSSSNEAALAFLVYNESLYENLVMPALEDKSPSVDQLQNHRIQARWAADLLMSAVYRGGDVSHPGREKLTRAQAQDIAYSWRHK